MSYFNYNYILSSINNKNKFNLSRNRKLITGFRNLFFFRPGDVISLAFRKKGYICLFKGYCIFKKYNNFKDSNTGFILRNVLMKVGIELSISFFYNRLFILRMHHYKTKKKMLSKNNLHFIKYKMILKT